MVLLVEFRTRKFESKCVELVKNSKSGIINDHIHVIVTFGLLQFDFNVVQFELLPIYQIVRHLFSEQEAGAGVWLLFAK